MDGLTDCFSELANLIGGAIKLQFEKRGLLCQITLPKTTLGEGKIVKLNQNHSLRLPFAIKEARGEILLNLSIIAKDKIQEAEDNGLETGTVMLF